MFAVKYRQGLWVPAWQEDLFRYITGVVQEHGHKLLAIGGVADHIHLALGLRAFQAPAELVQLIKQGSARWINDARLTPGRFAWQEGYGVFSHSRSPLPDLCRYIENQEAHHRKVTFRDEYRLMLQRFEVEYDERYLFAEPV